MLRDFVKTHEFNIFYLKHFKVSSNVPGALSNPSGLDYFALGTAVETYLDLAISRHLGKQFEHKRIIQRGLNEWVGKAIFPIYEEVANTCKSVFDEYISNGIVTHKFLMCLFKYCYVEDICRRLGLDIQDRAKNHLFKLPSEVDINTIRKIDISYFVLHHLDGSVTLNPGYSFISQFIGGADSDIAVGDALYEVKTVKTIDLQGTFKQLIGYYLCSIFEDVYGEINSLAIYSTRHNFVCKKSISEITKNHSDTKGLIIDFLSIAIGDDYLKIAGETRIDMAESRLIRSIAYNKA